MLTLTTPVLLGKYIYDRLVIGIRGEWDLRTLKLELMVSPGRGVGNDVVIGTRDTSGATPRVLTPPVISTLTIQDTVPHNPALNTLLKKLQDFLEACEAFAVNDPEFQAQIYQTGEEEVPLACTFTPYEPGAGFIFSNKVEV